MVLHVILVVDSGGNRVHLITYLQVLEHFAQNLFVSQLLQCLFDVDWIRNVELVLAVEYSDVCDLNGCIPHLSNLLCHFNLR